MATNTDELRDIFLDVADDAELTEHQEDGPSRDPVGDDEVSLAAEVEAGTREDGLEDAIDGAEVAPSAA